MAATLIAMEAETMTAMPTETPFRLFRLDFALLPSG